MAKREPFHAAVLLSGGIDSAACVAFCLERGYHVEAMHFSYGQGAEKRELKSAQAIAKHYDVKLHRRRISNANKKQSGHIVGRNAFLLFGGLLEFPWKSGLIGIGIHAGTPYFDCAKEFINRTQSLFDGYSSGSIKISAPFLAWEKTQIWDFCASMNVPISLTYSCEFGNKPCGKCLSCRDLEVLRGK